MASGRKPIELSVGSMGVFNYALYENQVSPVRGIKIKNNTDRIVEGLSLKITSSADFIKECNVDIPPLPVGKSVNIPDPDIIVDGHLLADTTDAFSINVTVSLFQDGKEIDTETDQMKILAYDQWLGDEWAEYIPAFIMPNHPVVAGLLHDASDILKKWGKDPALEGYQTEDPNRIRDFAAAAYTAIQNKNISYANPPAHAGICSPGQRIRTPETVIDQRLATCMDFTMLYAGCLEAIGLNAVLCVLKNHIFAGVWLKDDCSKNVITRNNGVVTKMMAKGNEKVSFVECTRMQAGVNDSYDQAEYKPDHPNFEKENFDYLVDVRAARNNGIRPIASRYFQNGRYQIDFQDRSEDEMSKAPVRKDIQFTDEIKPTKGKKITNKKELWESKLLDLSNHNMLLSLPLNSSVEPIMSVRIDELEDALSDGEEFHLYPVPAQILALGCTVTDSKGKSKELPWLSLALDECGGPYEMTNWIANSEHDFTNWLRQENKSHRLYSFRAPKELEKSLTSIYRGAQASQQENGVSSLYMAIGLLRWVDFEKKTAYHAPLILVPVEIIRKSANLGYSLHMRDEEPHFNLTLLEMLKQNHNLEIGGLDPLPRDDKGIDVRKTFAIVRGALSHIGHWDVVETCAVGNFSFAQFAMWNDMRQSDDVLEKSKIVRSLMKGRIDWEIPDAESWKDDETLLPISVDDTQLQAIKMANHGSTFVLHGPPGTGKSQTITCMIANLAAHGKKVLFVAEKMAALSVVERRLTSIGMGDFCLELHSDKANKKHVLSQLDKALNRAKATKDRDFEESQVQIAETRRQLDLYSIHLHQIHSCGYSIHDLIDMYEQVSEAPKYIPFSIDEASEMSREKIRSHRSLLGKLVAAGEAAGNVQDHPLESVQLDTYPPAMRMEVQRNQRDYSSAIHELADVGSRIAGTYGLETPGSLADHQKNKSCLDFWISLIEQLPDLQVYLNANPEYVRKAIQENEKIRKEEEKILQTWKPSFLKENIQGYLDRLSSAQKKVFGGKNAQKAVFMELQAHASKPLRSEKIPELCKDAIAYQKKAEQAEKARKAISAADNALLALAPTISKLDAIIQHVNKLREKAAQYPGGFDQAIAHATKKELPEDTVRYAQAIEDCCSAQNALNELLHRKGADAQTLLTDELRFMGWLSPNSAQLKDWTYYNRIKEECSKAGLAPVVKAYENGMPAEELYGAYRKGLCYALITDIMNHDAVLGGFTGPSFNEIIRQFSEMDQKLLNLTQKEIVRILTEQAQGTIFDWSIGTETTLLKKAISSNARGMSIRTLFERIPHALQRLCPVMLMSPNSVAQYLERKNDLFDVVIFDEASQLPTCKAVGALARAKDAVIVGDPKQMPPTSFFAGTGPIVDDLALDDLDSILDDALALNIPSQYLQWHYRSTHESLIAFSNHQFYENKMFTFPSANDRERHVTAVHVDGVYNKSVNPREAEAVVAEIIRRYKDPELQKQSIGVVTFNVKQQDLIYHLLQKQFQGNLDFDAWANNGDDPIFIKNLENVQGDERDVILFSIGYGPDDKGHVSMNFGPINKSGGGKRLNVAFSRARITMMIFTSLYSSQIKVTETSPDGLIAFHDFLRFAEGNELEAQAAAKVDEDDVHDGILNHICATIKEHGYECETHVGHSDFHIDIAVIDPYHPTQYLMGILLDGDQYRKTTNTRDREVSQFSVLKHLGWELIRIWTIDWWDDAERQTKRLLSKLDALKEKAHQKAEEEKAKENESVQNTEEQTRLQKELEEQAAEVLADEEQSDNNATATGTPVEVVDQPSETEAPQKVPEEQPSSESTPDDGAQPSETIDHSETETESEAVSDDSSSTQNEDAEVETDAEEEHAEKPETETSSEPEPSEEPSVDLTPPVSEITEEEIKPSVPEPAPKPAPEPVQQIMMDLGSGIKVVDYQFADLPQTQSTPVEFASSRNKQELIRRTELLLSTEAPIQKDALIRKLVASFGVTKQSLTVDATEKALKAIKAKNTKMKGNVFCWASEQDPKTYSLVRVTSDRSADELPPHEIRNAICLLLKKNGVMSRDSLISDASRLFGYKRLGKNLEASLINGLNYAKTNGDVTMYGQLVQLGEEDSPILYLQKHAFEYVDMTDRGGSLYFFDAEAAAHFKQLGYHVAFAQNGTRNTENRPCWYISPK